MNHGARPARRLDLSPGTNRQQGHEQSPSLLDAETQPELSELRVFSPPAAARWQPGVLRSLPPAHDCQAVSPTSEWTPDRHPAARKATGSGAELVRRLGENSRRACGQ